MNDNCDSKFRQKVINLVVWVFLEGGGGQTRNPITTFFHTFLIIINTHTTHTHTQTQMRATGKEAGLGSTLLFPKNTTLGYDDKYVSYLVSSACWASLT